jgi:hypothetical protein
MKNLIVEIKKLDNIPIPKKNGLIRRLNRISLTKEASFTGYDDDDKYDLLTIRQRSFFADDTKDGIDYWNEIDKYL